jgi:bifunctional ADP-heptose synthase (sugar kinase/adenylyltransferase)
MLDAYYYGEVTRISPEAPVPVAHVLHTKETLGGASNVAHNLALLGCRTSIAGFIGDDHHGRARCTKNLRPAASRMTG